MATQLAPGVPLTLCLVEPCFLIYSGHHRVGLPSRGCLLVELVADDKGLDKQDVLNGICWEV